MTQPKDKAQELVEKFKPLVRTPRFGKRHADPYYLAKEAALICVDHILKVYEYVDEDIVKRKEEFRPIEEYSYWNKVKEHIQSM